MLLWGKAVACMQREGQGERGGKGGKKGGRRGSCGEVESTALELGHFLGSTRAAGAPT